MSALPKSYSPDSPTVLQINLAALQRNYQKICSIAEGAESAGVVKANGYGLGAVEVVKALYKVGCRKFFVAHLQEAVLLREAYKDIDIYVLNGLMTGKAKDFLAHNIYPALNNLQDISMWKTQNSPCIIHFDTGMNRLGLGTIETKAFLEEKEEHLKSLDVHFIMSHFSSADENDHPETERQAKQFAELRKKLPETKVSLCNSAGVFVDPSYHYDLVRPGMALYGLNPTPHLDNPMERVVDLQTRVLNIQEAQAREHVGYGATYQLKERELLATVNLGYADGFFRSLGQKGVLFWNGIACPIRGRISMDLVTVSIEHLKEGKPNIGDMLEVIGPSKSPDQLAEDVYGGTIGYEVLTSLGHRYHKVYVSD